MGTQLECRGCDGDEYDPHDEACPHRPERMIDTSDWSLTQTTAFVRFGMRLLGKIYDWQHRKDGDAS